MFCLTVISDPLNVLWSTSTAAVVDWQLPGPSAVSAWQAVGRADLTEERVAAATDAFLRAVLS